MHVVLVESDHDLRTFPFAKETPACLQQVLGRSLLDRTISWLRSHGQDEIHLLTEYDAAEDYILTQAIVRHRLSVASSLGEVLHRAHMNGAMDEPLLVLAANLHPLPDFRELVRGWDAGKNAVAWIRGTSSQGPGRYTSGPPVAALASPIVSRMLVADDHPRPMARMTSLCRRKGLRAQEVKPNTAVHAIDNTWSLYQANLGMLTTDWLESGGANELQVSRVSGNLWVAPGAHAGRVHVDPTGGPVVLGIGADVADGAMLRGPTLIGEASSVGADSCVHRALVLEQSLIPEQSWIANAVVSPRLTECVAA